MRQSDARRTVILSLVTSSDVKTRRVNFTKDQVEEAAVILAEATVNGEVDMTERGKSKYVTMKLLVSYWKG